VAQPPESLVAGKGLSSCTVWQVSALQTLPAPAIANKTKQITHNDFAMISDQASPKFWRQQ